MSKALGWDLLLDHLLDPALLYGADGALLRWNDAAVALLGLAAKTEAGAGGASTGLDFFDRDGTPLRGRGDPLAATLADGKPRALEGFVRHANGHLVPVVGRLAGVPAAGGAPGVTFVLLRDDSEKALLRRQVDDLRDQALIDAATGAVSRTCTELQLVTRLAELDRYGWSFGALHVAVDDWEGLARRYGEVHRRDLIKLVADSLLHSARASDLVGRWDDAEFLVLLTNVDETTIRNGAERYRRVVEQGQHQAYGEDVHVTVSVGATWARRNDSVGVLLERLAQQVAACRKAGGNRVSVSA